MSDDRLTDPARPSTPLGERRKQVLDALRASDEPLGAADVADRLRMPVNTARFNLDALVEARLAERTTAPRTQPGRPKVVYRATSATPAGGTRSFRLLAEILTGFVATTLTDPAPAAREAGRAWGRYLTEDPPPYSRIDADEAAERVAGVLDDMGFAPELLPVDDGTEVRLHHCPFREVAERHTDVVCQIHLGLMQGALDKLGAPLTADSLTPFVTPDLCVGHLARDGKGAA